MHLPSAMANYLAVAFTLLAGARAADLATVTPCPDCPSAIAPSPITVHSQYQTVSACKPSTTTVFTTSSALNQTRIGSAISTVPSCTPSVFVSTTIPAYSNGVQTSTLVTETEQPVTFNYLHTVKTRAVVARAETTCTTTSTTTSTVTTTTTTLTLSTTIAVKSYCDYASIGPLAIPGYEGSGLCTDCGPDANGVLTQKFTVVSCENKKCTTFNETWLASPKTHLVDGKNYVATTTDVYCPTATPETQMPGYTAPAPAAYPTAQAAPSPAGQGHQAAAAPTPYAGKPAGTPESYGHPASYAAPPSPAAYPSQEGGHPAGYGAAAGPVAYSSQAGGHPASYGAAPSPAPYASQNGGHPASYPAGTTLKTYATPTRYAHPTTTCTDSEVEPTAEPTSYNGGNGNDGGDDGSADPSSDPSGALGYDPPQPTTYGRPSSYKVFKRQGMEMPRGSVMRRSGLLFWGV